jgi:hypothetical protein
MMIVEGIKVKAKTIPRKQLVSMWKKLTLKPFPRVQAFQLPDSDFDHIIRLKKCREDEAREMEEWGKLLSTEGTDACVFNAEESSNVDYMILIRENPYHSLGEVLHHELVHIARGDL